MIVGYKFDTYAEKRNIIGLVNEAEYKKVRDLFALKDRIIRKLNGVVNREIFSRNDLSNQFYDFNINQVSLLHFFNAISYGSIPWITTFETLLPRFACLLSCPCDLTLEPNFSALKTHSLAIRASALLLCLIVMRICKELF